MAIGRRTARSLAPSLIACGVLIASLLPASLLPAPAVGVVSRDDYRDTGSDPDDPNEWMNLDSTTRTVWTGRDGRRWLMVKLVPFSSGWYDVLATVRLDVDGDRAADFAMTFVGLDTAGVSCRIHGQGRSMEGRVHEAWADPIPFSSCHVPLSFVKPTHEIAWWAMVEDAEWRSDDRERAPNVGWYV